MIESSRNISDFKVSYYSTTTTTTTTTTLSYFFVNLTTTTSTTTTTTATTYLLQENTTIGEKSWSYAQPKNQKITACDQHHSYFKGEHGMLEEYEEPVQTL